MIQSLAQVCLDGLAAVGLAAYALAARREAGPLIPRLILLFGLMAAFYAGRALHAVTGLDGLKVAAFAAVAMAPTAALLLAEGVLRRHAPRLLKLAVMGASLVALGFALLTARDMAFDARIGLAGPIVLSLMAILALLGTRDRDQLSASENRVVAALALCLAAALPLILTDFTALMTAWIGLSPIAALLIVLVTLSSANGDPRGTAVEIGLLLAVAAGVALGLAQALALSGLAHLARLFAVVLAGQIVASLLVRLHAQGTADRRGGLRRRLVRADAGSVDHFLADLAEEPLLKDMTVLEAGQLADHDAQALAAVLARRPVWSLERLKAGEAAASLSEAEPLIDLLERHGATHAGLLSLGPARVALARLPGLARGVEAEIDLALAFRMARLVAERR
ncbi:hypothetical protein ASD89_16365 [Caulobacter sp. Root656]|nr:hypothetical protein ASD89_16365 [Caulobacter sp. Root656]